MIRPLARLGLVAAAAVIAVAVPAAAETGSIFEYSVPTVNSQPVSIVAGLDGHLWFTEFRGNKIARMTTDGVFTEFEIPTTNSQPDDMDVGPDGNLWFAEVLGNRFGRITTTGVITEFLVPTPNSRPTVVVAGPDGNLWFTERGTLASPGNKIGRITPERVITEWALPNPSSRPLGITAGADGNVWFTEQAGNRIGRIDPATGAITEFPLPSPNSQPWEIIGGPDGNVWFTEFSGNRIGRITPDGTITEFRVPTPASQPNTIRRGPDPNPGANCAYQQEALGGAAFADRYGSFGGCVVRLASTKTLWFTETAANRIAQVTTDGDIFEYAIPTTGSQPIGITHGPDGAVWFAELAGNKIGRLDLKTVGKPIAPGGRARSGSIPPHSTGWNHRSSDMSGPEPTAAPADAVRRLIEAFNARDLAALLALTTDDIEIRNPLGNALRGAEGVREFLRKNEEMGVHVEQDGPAHVDGDRVAVPTVMRLSFRTEMRSAGVFDRRGGKVTGLSIVMDRTLAGLP